MPRATGFSLLEVIVAMALTTTIAASVFGMMHPTRGAFASEPEVSDMQQRLRVAVDALTEDLAASGAGVYLGDRTGPLIRFFAPVLPFRKDLSGEDPIGTATTDTVTAITVPASAAQTTLTGDLLPGVLIAQAVAEPGCPAGTELCGFSPGMTVAVFDDAGSVGLFTVAGIDDAMRQIALADRVAEPSFTTYRSGSSIVQVNVHTLSLKSDPASQTFQLRHGDGSGVDVPVVDHLVRLAFDYYGEPRPPTVATGATSYGPAPPPIDVRTNAYPAGENCIFQIDPASGEPVSRLPPLGGGTGLVALTAAQLGDGPWCPDDTAPNRWDADLLRIRAIDITIRVEAALAALRGPAGVLFTNPGVSTSPSRWAPDREIRWRVSPRNLNLGRP
jgi:Prokaryotic N-terminal methylation motif